MSKHTNAQKLIKTFTVRLEAGLARRVALAAASHDTTKMAIVAEAVEIFLDRLEAADQLKKGARNGKAVSV